MANVSYTVDSRKSKSIGDTNSDKTQNLSFLDFEFYQEHLNEKLSHSTIHTVEQDFTQITSMEKLMIQYILKNTIDQLVILNLGRQKEIARNSSPENLNQEYVPVPLKETFKERLRKTIYFQPTIQLMGDALLSMIDIKMGNDVDYVRRVFQDTLNELERNASFESLQKPVMADLIDEEDEFQLLTDYTKNKNYLEYLEKKLKNDSRDSELLIKDLDGKIAELENKINDAKHENSIKTKLVEKWERTRFDQEELILKNEEKLLIAEYNRVEKEINIEDRAIRDIEAYVRYKISTTEILTEHWMKKYETEVEQLDDDIQLTKENIIDLKLKNEELHISYESRQKEMDEYWAIKRAMREALELEAKKWQCAIRIQAWWRGTMVRKGFGRFRKKKKGKAGKGKK